MPHKKQGHVAPGNMGINEKSPSHNSPINSENSTNPFNKAEALKAQTFKPLTDAALFNTPSAFYPPENNSPY
jgi:hypothetical protein